MGQRIMSDLTEKLFQKAREDCPESKAVYRHICWEAANLIGDLEQRVADLEHELGKVESQFFTCNQLYDEQAKQIEKLDDTRIEYIGMINKLVDERENLKTENEILKTLYNQGIDDAADLLNSVDLPREELAASVRKLKK